MSRRYFSTVTVCCGPIRPRQRGERLRSWTTGCSAHQFGFCPDPDGQLDAVDNLVARRTQILDLTTDQSFSEWRDFDGDGCCIAGKGPSATFNPCTTVTGSPVGAAGACLDKSNGTVTLAATGTSPSVDSPLFDLTFSMSLPCVVSGPNPSGTATCAAPPPIDFAGTKVRCLP